MNDNPRKSALRILSRVRRENAFAAETLSDELIRVNLSSVDSSFVSELFYGVLRNLIYLDYWIADYSITLLKKIEPQVRDILRLGMYQLIFMDRVPDHAAVNETVNLAPKRASGFVNAILKQIIRQPPSHENVKADGPIRKLSIQTSHPEWIVRKFTERFGNDGARELCQANQSPPINVIRANTLINSPSELIEYFNTIGIESAPAKYAKNGVVVRNLNKVLKNDVYSQGRFVVQGEASQLCTELLDPKPGERILDMCAAPGGKTTNIAQLVGPKGKVTACDVLPAKLEKVTWNANLLGLKNIVTVTADMTGKPPARIGSRYDRVLVDAPCSGLGELGKNPDARYRKVPENIISLVGIQRLLMQQAAKLVKPGGVLVYSTCTLTIEENEGIIERFCNLFPGFELVSALEILGEDKKIFVTKEGYFLSAPHITGTTGFFAARLVKKKYS